jgi:hypothetical protein
VKFWESVLECLVPIPQSVEKVGRTVAFIPPRAQIVSGGPRIRNQSHAHSGESRCNVIYYREAFAFHSAWPPGGCNYQIQNMPGLNGGDNCETREIGYLGRVGDGMRYGGRDSRITIPREMKSWR